ncbi:MAG: DNA polymerase III subunit gamma/tau, partial [Myxococcota bacterium]
MAYTVFARKYRPQTFESLVGQEHVARTLAGAIESGRVAHAFLFTGVRGVGKTTSARLLAKALCCEHGPTPTPCNKCPACLDITAGVDMDVQEIDGASNNGVDDVRRLQESLPYRPARNRFKIVIVDEVHMLSAGAFNAFLKTLEEPPEHVKFIFATTESHKVPVTIRSRCQRYDFRLIPQQVVADAVRRILDAEGVKADDGAVRIVAREAAGSMRDALTLLDQLVAFGDDGLTAPRVAEQLGIAARESVQRAVATLLEGDAAGALGAVDAVLSQSADPLHFARQVIQHLRDGVVLRMTGDETELVDLVTEERDELRRLVAPHEPLELQRVFAGVAKLVDEIAEADRPRLALEMGFVRIATRPALQGVEGLIARLEALEERLGPGGGGPRRGGTSGRGGRGGRPPQAPRGSAAPATRAGPSAQVGPSAPVASGAAAARADASEIPIPASSAPRSEAPRSRSGGSASSAEASPKEEGSPGVASPGRDADAALSQRPPAQRPPAQRPPAQRPPAQRPPAQRPPAQGASAQPRETSSADSEDASPVRRAALQEWGAIVDELREARPALAAVLEHGVPRAVSAERIVLSFQKNSFYGRQADAPAAREAIGEAAKKRFDASPPIEVRFDLSADDQGRSVAAVEATRRDARQKQRRRDALNHPV